MTANDVRTLVRQRPFIPFRVVTTLGDVYDVHHPDMVLIGLSSVTIGVPSDEDPEAYGQMHIVSYRHVVRLEPSPSPADGSAS